MITKTDLFKQPVEFKGSCRILCCYTNTSEKLQIIKISNIPNFYWERVIFSNQRLMFEAVQGASLEVVSCNKATNTEIIIPCQDLQVRTSPA